MRCVACRRLNRRSRICILNRQTYRRGIFMSLVDGFATLEATRLFPGNSSYLLGTSFPLSPALQLNSTSQTNQIGHPLLIHETMAHSGIPHSMVFGYCGYSSINPSSQIERLNSTLQTNNEDIATNEITLTENRDPSELFQRLKVWKWPRHGPGCPVSEHTDAVENSCICIRIAKDSSCSDIDIRRDRSAPVEAAVSVIPSEFDPNNTSCIFCLCEFSNNDTLCTLPCNHTFHENGVYKWLIQKENHFRCPTCRKSVFE